MNAHMFHRKSVLKLSSLPHPVLVPLPFWTQFKFLNTLVSGKVASEEVLLSSGLEVYLTLQQLSCVS